MTRMQQRRGSAAAWTTADPTLDPGEIGFETDTGSVKVGDGTTAWTGLAYLAGEGGASAVLSIAGEVGHVSLADLAEAGVATTAALDVHLAETGPGVHVPPLGGQPSSYVLSGAGWVAAGAGGGASTASELPFVPGSGVVAADVQAAVEEVATDVSGLAGSLAQVATSGAYGDLSGAPTIPTVPGDIGAEVAGAAATVNTRVDGVVTTVGADVTALDGRLDTLEGFDAGTRLSSAESDISAVEASITGLATVATTGDYGDLAGTPTIPSTPGDVGADPAGTATTAVAGHADDIGPGSHLPAGGSVDQFVAHNGTTAVWASAPGGAQAIRVVWNPAGEGSWEPAPGAAVTGWGIVDFYGPERPIEAHNGVDDYWPLRSWDTFTEVGIA